MSNLIRWEPMREMMTLREAMDRLFDDAFTRPISLSGGSALPAIDMYQTERRSGREGNLAGSQGGRCANHRHRRDAHPARRFQAGERTEGNHLSPS